jgi:hypothetical protein
MSAKKKAKPTDDVPSHRTFEEFDALSEADKDKVWKYYDRKIPLSEMPTLTRAERAQFERAIGRRPRPGRPKIGQSSKVVYMTLQKGFLQRVDAYAAKHKLKRAELIVQGLRKVTQAQSLRLEQIGLHQAHPNPRIPK